jgi:mycoredoxin
MLNVYTATWCPHCKKTIEYLKAHDIEMNLINIEKEAEDVVKKVIDVNGGFDWVVPTLEFNGKWRPGKVFNANELEKDLKEMGVMTS